MVRLNQPQKELKPVLQSAVNANNITSYSPGQAYNWNDNATTKENAFARRETNQPTNKTTTTQGGSSSSKNIDSGYNAGVGAYIQANNLSVGGRASGPGVGGIGAFKPSDAYNQAMAYTNQLLAQLSSGRTSYTDKVNAMMDQIANRDKFSYDPDTDPLFQQYLQNSMESGKKAMNDTIGQASALTGGYGSTYATAAANGAYNNYVADAYDNLTDYYNAALNTYESETQDLYNKLGMYNTADQTEYDRLATAYSANLSNADRMYNQEYSNYWDTANYNQKAAIENANLAYKYAALNQDKELASARASASANGSYKEPSKTEYSQALEAFNTGGWDAFDRIVDSYGSNVDVEALTNYVNQNGMNYNHNGNMMMINSKDGSATKVNELYNSLLKQGYTASEAKKYLTAWGYTGTIK